MMTYSQIFKALPAEARDNVIGAFRGNRDRWQSGDRMAMASAITAEEDRLEYCRHSRTPQKLATRETLKTLRRALEVSCSP